MVRAATRSNGFTLVELMVALAIFGMLSAAGVMLFASGVRSQEAAARRLDTLGDEGRMTALLVADLAQAVPRVSRDAGGALLPAFSGTNGVGSAPVLAFVRGGVSNPGNAARSSLQRVAYRLRDGRLERVTYAQVDGDANEQVTVLAERIERLTLRYRAPGGAWADRWQPLEPQQLPRAAELTLTRSGQAPLVMAFLVGVPA